MSLEYVTASYHTCLMFAIVLLLKSDTCRGFWKSSWTKDQFSWTCLQPNLEFEKRTLYITNQQSTLCGNTKVRMILQQMFLKKKSESIIFCTIQTDNLDLTRFLAWRRHACSSLFNLKLGRQQLNWRQGLNTAGVFLKMLCKLWIRPLKTF